MQYVDGVGMVLVPFATPQYRFHFGMSLCSDGWRCAVTVRWRSIQLLVVAAMGGEVDVRRLFVIMRCSPRGGGPGGQDGHARLRYALTQGALAISPVGLFLHVMTVTDTLSRHGSDPCSLEPVCSSLGTVSAACAAAVGRYALFRLAFWHDDAVPGE